MSRKQLFYAVHYVPSKENPDDAPSRKLLDMDCMHAGYALGIKYSNAFVVAIRSISCHWIANVRSLGIHHARHRFPRGLTYLLSFLPHNNLRFPPFVLIGYNSSSSKISTVHSQSSFLTSHLGVFGGLSFTGS